MTNSKTTKRALVTSALAVLMCVSMLIGTTFAWFTDTASTSVNKIQAGTLKIQLLDKDGNDLEGETLDFAKAEGAEDEELLWEPGCTYVLPDVYVKNNGNLALKYKVVISGIDGDAKLNEAIEWTVEGLVDGEGHLLPGESSDAIAIKGHMDKDAGNEYQGLSIEGVAITVYATQDTVEHDSFNNTYDENAEYGVSEDAFRKAIAEAEDGDVVTLEGNVHLDSALTLNKNVTIDGNGYEISGAPVHVNGTDSASIKNVVFTAPENSSNNASNLYIGKDVKDIVLDGCTFEGTQWDGVQITPVTGSSITINNCKFEEGVGNTVKRYIHIEVPNGSACTADVKVTLTNNSFASSAKLTDDIIGIYGVDASGINYGGNNTFADQDGIVFIGWSANAYANNQSDVYALLTGK